MMYMKCAESCHTSFLEMKIYFHMRKKSTKNTSNKKTTYKRRSKEKTTEKHKSRTEWDKGEGQPKCVPVH